MTVLGRERPRAASCTEVKGKAGMDGKIKKVREIFL